MQKAIAKLLLKQPGEGQIYDIDLATTETWKVEEK